MTRINLETSSIDVFEFHDKKLFDFSFNKKAQNEFLISGDLNCPYSYYYAGFLNINKFEF